MLEPGQTAQISTSVNPELMGGMVVSIGDKYTEMKECYSIFTLFIRLVKLEISTLVWNIEQTLNTAFQWNNRIEILLENVMNNM